MTPSPILNRVKDLSEKVIFWKRKLFPLLTRNASKRYIDEMVHLLNGGLIRVLSRI